MKSRSFLIPSLLVAGLSMPQCAEAAPAEILADAGEKKAAPNSAITLFRGAGAANFTGHRSHSSHSSHRSSSGTSVYIPEPVYRPAPVYTPPPVPQSFVRPRPISPTPQHEEFTRIVERVQRGLIAYGYDAGEIDGVIGASTRAALERFQHDYTLPVTGTITPGVLEALGITP